MKRYKISEFARERGVSQDEAVKDNQRYIEGGHQIDTDQHYADSIMPKDCTAVK